MITGDKIRDAFISAANNISNHKQEVDALNVFPVPDGDTGTNMSMTMNAAKRELQRLDDNVSVAQVAQTTASALLRGARGNSGVILSLLFRGFAKALAGKETAEAVDVVGALESGVENAYKAVMKPTEGTILTVARLSAQHAAEVYDDGMRTRELFSEVLKAANETLEQTPDLLPVLKKAGVVDAGGKGLCLIYEGIFSVIMTGEVIPDENEETKPEEAAKTRNAAGEIETDIHFTYCTEFIILKNEKKMDQLLLRAYLDSIGDCVVVVDDDDIIKVHVHTDNPGNALQEALKYGQLTNIKIENMREQHANQKASVEQTVPTEDPFPYRAVDPSTEYGFVAVAAGEGIQQLFIDLGVDNIVNGGQTMNPSTDDILKAIHATPAKTVFVLPNNKNIIMAAEQTIRLADRRVFVLPTRTIPQGLAAMLAFDPSASRSENRTAMSAVIEKVGTGNVTFAARDSNYDGHRIKQGEILALENGRLAFTEKDLTKAVVKLTRALLKRDSAFITLIHGKDVPKEEAEKVYATLCEKLPDDIEVTLIDGGQPVYYYIISVE